MGDDFVRLVDPGTSSVNKAITSESSLHRMNLGYELPARKRVECRICRDEDEDTNLEAPCSCSGSLKYAHRICVQRWCNEKGDTICEICHKQFKPGYTSTPPLLHRGGSNGLQISINHSPTAFVGGNWEMPRRDLNYLRYIAMATRDHEYLDSDFDDDDSSALSPRSLTCCRVVAIIFMVLLALRHTLPIIIGGEGDYSLTLFVEPALRTIGILLPIYVMAKAFAAIQRYRHQQDPRFQVATSDEENELPQVQALSRIIRVR